MAGIIAYYPLAALALVGGWYLRRRRQGMLWPLLVPAIAATVGVAVTYGQTRFRAAAEPTIVILAAVALVTFWQHFFPNRAVVDDPHPTAADAPALTT
jgi:hypothetical protein